MPKYTLGLLNRWGVLCEREQQGKSHGCSSEQITTLWFSNGKSAKRNTSFLKTKENKNPLERRSRGRDVNRGSTCAPPPFGQQMLVSALGSTGEPKLFIFVQQLLSQSNMRCCLAALTVHACKELCGTSYNGADTCQARLAAVCWIGGWLHNVDAELYQCSSICKATGAASLAQLHSYGFLTSCLFIMWSSLIEGENIFCEFS